MDKSLSLIPVPWQMKCIARNLNIVHRDWDDRGWQLLQYNIFMNATLAMLVDTGWAVWFILESTRWVLEVAEDMVPVLIFKSHNKWLQTDALSPSCRAAQCLQKLSRVRQRAVKMRLLDDGAFSRPIVASKKYREMAEKCTTQTYHQFRLQRPGMMGLPVIIYLGSIIS